MLGQQFAAIEKKQEVNQMAGRALAVNENTAAPTEEQIRQRAYELYEQGGCQAGKELEYWLQAEAEFKQREQKEGPRAAASATDASKAETSVLRSKR